MKTTAEETVMDTSKMNAGQRAALELTEAARDAASEREGFAAGLFMGRLHAEHLLPFPEQSAADRGRGDVFLKKLDHFLIEHTDPDAIDRDGEIPDEVIAGLAQMGAFGIKVGTRFGGLGLSQTNYCRVAMLLGGWCANLTALISAHQSIGVPQPLILFGTEEQKWRFLPRIARGEITAFALTEKGVGSDPARMETHAEPSADGTHFILNGEKLWCTNGTKAGLLVVMAKTPSKKVHGIERRQITAFIVEANSPGVEVVTRCHFMGLRALYNGVIRFTDVRVPRENIILDEGKGLKVALSTLNTGRLTLPAACTGLAKRCLEIVRHWASEREQWGAPIGKHGAIADKIARIAAHTFAMESMAFYSARLADQDKNADIRLEAAMAKLWSTERAWEIVNETLQIRGGRGYETADSLRARGEESVPIERMMRDCRINTIFEGSSEIMRLFLAREALDPHLKIGAAVLHTQLSWAARAKAAVKAGLFYAHWYPRLWCPRFGSKNPNLTDKRLSGHWRWAERTGRRLARRLFHSMLRYGPKLEKQQILLGRFVDIGTEIFAVTTSCSRAQSLANRAEPEAIALADYFSKLARLRVERLFEEIGQNADREGYALAQSVIEGKAEFLEERGATVRG